MESIKTVFFCILFLSAGSLSAQTFSTIQLNIGTSKNNVDFDRERNDLWRAFPERFNPKRGWSAEGLVFLEVTPEFFLGTGIHFNQTKFDHSLTGIQTSGDIFNGTYISYEETVTINHIGIPLQIQYVVFEKKIKVEVHTGCLVYKPFTKVSETRVIGAEAELDIVFANARPLEKIANPSGLNIAPFVGLDFSYPITKRDFLKISGRFQWYLLPKDYYYTGANNDIRMKGVSLGYVHKINP